MLRDGRLGPAVSRLHSRFTYSRLLLMSKGIRIWVRLAPH